MDLRRYGHLIAHLETEAHIAPRLYTLRVALLAALGYGYIFAVLGALIGLVAWLYGQRSGHGGLGVVPASAAFVLYFGVLALLLLIGRAMMMPMEAPEGVEVKRQDAPELFRLLDRIRTKLKGPPLHHVLLTGQLNAAIVQRPLLGVLGMNRNYLLIGMPLLQTFGPAQAAAVLAHEYGHLAGSHGAFSAWIYRIRYTWELLLMQLHAGGHAGRHLFTWFYDRYVPYFLAYTFVFARANEYEADRAAAAVAGPAEAAGALVLVNIRNDYLRGRYWPEFLKNADQAEAPPALPHAGMRAALLADAGEDDRRWLKLALTRGTGLEDTHPSLTDRLASLGEAPALPPRAGKSAAEALFGIRLKRYVDLLDAEWSRENLAAWQARHAQAEKDRATLKSLNARIERGEQIAPLYLMTRAELTERFEGAEAAMPLYRAVLEAHAGLPEAHLALGRLLAGRGDLAAVTHLEAAMRIDDRNTWEACHLAWHTLAQHGQRTEADRYMQKLADYEAEQFADEGGDDALNVQSVITFASTENTPRRRRRSA